MSFVDHLKQDIASSHTDIEKTPFAASMVSGRINRETYSLGLSQLGLLHQALENHLSENESFSGIYSPEDMNRAEIVERDLAVLGQDGPSIPNETTNRMIDQFSEWAGRSPWSLIGALYVFEGSRMGSMYLARSLSKGFGLECRPGVGLDYHVDGMANRPVAWKRFKENLAAKQLSPSDQDDIRRGAIETMAMLCDLYAAIPIVSVELVLS